MADEQNATLKQKEQELLAARKEVLAAELHVSEAKDRLVKAYSTCLDAQQVFTSLQQQVLVSLIQKLQAEQNKPVQRSDNVSTQ